MSKKTRAQLIAERTEAEMQRGAQRVVARILAKEFDPDYVPEFEGGYMPSPEEQRHREEYRRINRRLRGDPDAQDQ